jgi:hypothetical protein
MELNPNVWGKWYWGFLHTIALTYPNFPNANTKKKYYELVNNFPLFIPCKNISNDFSKLINCYPVSPYLDNRDSFIRWTHFIHNKVNEKLEKPLVSLNDFYLTYYEQYKPPSIKFEDFNKLKKKIIYIFLICIILFNIYYFYDK